MAWSSERVDLLLKLNDQHHSAKQIAEKLGGGVTRNAVIGKLNRMGLACGGGKPSSSKSRIQARIQGRVGGGRLQAPISRQRKLVVVKPSHLEPAQKDIQLCDLTEHSCRFPMGDPREKDFRFCGGKTQAENSYCAHHMQVAHQRSTRGVAKEVLAENVAEVQSEAHVPLKKRAAH